MRWTKEAVLAGPNVRAHLEELEEWHGPTLLSTFAPLLPSRLSMWACLMGQAFKSLPQAVELWRSGTVPPNMFRRHANKLRSKLGIAPHMKHVWDSIIAEFQAQHQLVSAPQSRCSDIIPSFGSEGP